MLVVTLAVRHLAGRMYAYALLSLPLAAAAWLHVVWLPATASVVGRQSRAPDIWSLWRSVGDPEREAV